MAFQQIKRQLGLDGEDAQGNTPDASQDNSPISPYEYDEGASGGQALRSLLKNTIGDQKPAPGNEGIQSISSPIDYLAGGLGAKLGSAAATPLAEGASKYLTSGEGALGQVGSIGSNIQPEISLSQKIQQGALNKMTPEAINVAEQTMPSMADKIRATAAQSSVKGPMGGLTEGTSMYQKGSPSGDAIANRFRQLRESMRGK